MPRMLAKLFSHRARKSQNERVEGDEKMARSSTSPTSSDEDDFNLGRDNNDSTTEQQTLSAPPAKGLRKQPSKQSTMGRRKPSNAEHIRLSSDLVNHKEPKRNRSKTLYFGENGPGFSKRTEICIGGRQSGQADGQPTAEVGTMFATDHSGFVNAGIHNNINVGYSSITYGGSLQYDYAGAQAYGPTAVSRNI